MAKPKSPIGHNPFASLGSIRQNLPPGKAAQEGQPENLEGSIEVEVEDRAGRAPYNFVPMPHKIRWLDNYSPPPHSRYDPKLLSGYIDLELKALSDFYIRGTWLLREYPGKHIKDQERPFEIACKLRLPGSSLRGMIRTLLEILAYSPLDPISNSRCSYRTLGASATTGHPEFEPLAARYRELTSHVQAGYLKRASVNGTEQWVICPAKRINGLQIYKVKESGAENTRQAVQFDTPAKSPDPYQRFLVVPSYADQSDNMFSLPFKGWIVRSGKIERRRYYWIINEPNPDGTPLPIIESDFEKHREAGLTGWIDKEISDPKYSEDGLPVFYKQTDDGPVKIWFGPTYNFRVPYLHTTHDFNRACRVQDGEERLDLVRAIFGYAPRLEGTARREGLRSRVFFEDALELERTDLISTEAVLGAPQPSTYQHYLEQRSQKSEEAVHWNSEKDIDGRAPRLRGFKAYWHRPGATINAPSESNQRVATKFLRAKSGARFRARVRFENLTNVELGSVLTAIELPGDCAHRLGMGKPLGLGSFQTTAKLFEINRDDRYKSLFDDASTLTSGAGSEPTDSGTYKLAFSGWILDWLQSGTATADIWNDPLCPPRLLDLKRLLTFNGVPHQEDWQHATRYLAFGTIPGYFPQKKDRYNEYHAVGWPGQPKLSRRRPLPPPKQVMEFEKVPKSSRPKFRD